MMGKCNICIIFRKIHHKPQTCAVALVLGFVFYYHNKAWISLMSIHLSESLCATKNEATAMLW